jgi:hypothetical protein
MAYEKAGPNDDPGTDLAKAFLALSALKSPAAGAQGQSAGKPDASLESTSSSGFSLRREKFNLEDKRIKDLVEKLNLANELMKDSLEEPGESGTTVTTASIPVSAALERLRATSATGQSSEEIVQRLSRKLGI